ncbi:MAG: GPW/gp25 family protein [Novosphingobium sp.]|nr:GPW/gp25 family protein [Novosphingobium sp.]
MNGTDASTGKRLSGLEHLAQSIADILTTPIGSRVCRREYGSPLFELLARPMNGPGKVRLFAAVAVALQRWEPRLRLTRVLMPVAGPDGAFTIRLEGYSTEEPAPNGLLRLTVPLPSFSV